MGYVSAHLQNKEGVQWENPYFTSIQSEGFESESGSYLLDTIPEGVYTLTVHYPGNLNLLYYRLPNVEVRKNMQTNIDIDLPQFRTVKVLLDKKETYQTKKSWSLRFADGASIPGSVLAFNNNASWENRFTIPIGDYTIVSNLGDGITTELPITVSAGEGAQEFVISTPSTKVATSGLGEEVEIKSPLKPFENKEYALLTVQLVDAPEVAANGSNPRGSITSNDQRENSFHKFLNFDEQGRVEIKELPAGSYSISTSHTPGLAYISQAFQVTAGEHKQITLEQGSARLTGHIRGAQGRTTIRTKSNDQKPYHHLSWFLINDKLTVRMQGGAKIDDEGRYEIDGLKPGTYRLVYQGDNIMHNYFKVEVVAGDNTFDLELPTSHIEGQLIGDTESKKIIISPKNLVRRGGNSYGRIEANSEGRFFIDHLPVGDYEMTLRSNSMLYRSDVSIKSKSDVVNVELRKPQDLGQIKGEITNLDVESVLGNPARSISISAYLHKNGQNQWDIGNYHSIKMEEFAQGKAAYTFKNLPQGRYALMVSSPFDRDIPPLFIPNVEVRKDLQTNLDLVMPEGRKVTFAYDPQGQNTYLKAWALRIDEDTTMPMSVLLGSNPSGHVATSFPFFLPLGDFTILAHLGDGITTELPITVTAGEGVQEFVVSMPTEAANETQAAEPLKKIEFLLTPEGLFYKGKIIDNIIDLKAQLSNIEHPSRHYIAFAISTEDIPLKDYRNYQSMLLEVMQELKFDHVSNIGVQAPSQAALQAKCANNLKQLGLVIRMYANESQGGNFPSPNQLSITKDVIYPEFMADPKILMCPAEVRVPPEGLSDKEKVQWYFDNSDYWYIAHGFTNEIQGQAYLEAYRKIMEEGDGNLDVDFDTPNSSTPKAPRIRKNAERYFVTDINDPKATQKKRALVPVLIERPGNHGHGGRNVLFMDGHVENIPYPGKFPMTKAFIEGLQTLDTLPAKEKTTSKEPEQENTSFVVTGTVNDTSGQPIPGVHIGASTGFGTLLPTGSTVTKNDGSYRLKFRPGYSSRNETTGKSEVSVQAATISARKPGYYEQNMCRQGDLRMASSLADIENSKWATPENTVLAGTPFRLDFVMVPAAQIKGQLLDKKGKPLAGQKISLLADPLAPSTSVLRSIETDAQGKFECSDVPLSTLWFEIGSIKSQPRNYTEVKLYEINLVYDASRSLVSDPTTYALQNNSTYTLDFINAHETTYFLDRIGNPDPGYHSYAPLWAVEYKADNVDEATRLQIVDTALSYAEDTSRSFQQRFQCCYLAAAFEIESSIPRLSAILAQDPNSQLQVVAACALGQFDSDTAKIELEKALKTESDEDIRNWITRAINGEFPRSKKWKVAESK